MLQIVPRPRFELEIDDYFVFGLSLNEERIRVWEWKFELEKVKVKQFFMFFRRCHHQEMEFACNFNLDILSFGFVGKFKERKIEVKYSLVYIKGISRRCNILQMSQTKPNPDDDRLHKTQDRQYIAAHRIGLKIISFIRNSSVFCYRVKFTL